MEFPQVIIVEASAGSGKTYCLAKRYLKLIIDSYPNNSLLRNILAITFTNKATVEMKERIIELLKKISLDGFVNKAEKADIMGLFDLSEDKVRQKALLIMDELIKHYNSFQVQTIDSFINALLLGSAFSIDRSASFKIKRDYVWQLGYCLDLVIEQAAKSNEIFDFLDKFLEHYLFVENRTGWFPKSDIQDLMHFLFRLVNKYGKEFKLHRGSSKEVIKKKKYIYVQIKDLHFDSPEGMPKTAHNSIKNFLEKNNIIFEIRNLPKCFQEPIVPINKGQNASSDYRNKWKRVHKSIKDLIELDAAVAYNPYVQFFRKLVYFFQQVSKEEDIVFLEELNQKARYLFGDSGITVAELYYRLATRFQHYLIDEFQDTSILQWQNLELMVEEGLSSGGSLFYVGDKKQAIYRFRGGEAELFDTIKEKFKHFNIESMHLIKNWRSQKAIVEFNNKVFSRDNMYRALDQAGIKKELETEAGAIEEVLDIFKDANQEYKQDNAAGYVYAEYIKEKNQAERDDLTRSKILNLLRDLKARFDYGDIAILTRDNSEVELVTSWLLESGYPVESEKTLNVIKNPLIKEVISLLKFLNSPVDDLNFAAFILGEVFHSATGISKADITKLILNSRKDRATGDGLSLYRIFRDNYPEIWHKYMEILFRRVGFISTYELTVDIYSQLKVMINFKNSQAFFMKFLELIKTKEEEHTGLEDFITYLKSASDDDLYVNITHGNSIKILTIHKSKGLEFPVVIIPFLRIDIRPETGGKGTNSYIVSEGDEKLGLMRITKNHLAYSPFLQKIYTQAFKKACIDELNNIYVAQTRAQFELYIFIPQKSGSAKNKACFIIPEDLMESGTKNKYSVIRQDRQTLLEVSPKVYRDWTRVLEGDFGSASSIENRERILKGNVLHAMLSKIGNCQGCALDDIIDSALEYAMSRFSLKMEKSIYRGKLKKLLTSKGLRNIFYISQGQVYCEKEVSNKFGDLKRIDRFILTDKQALIIDYKIKDINSDEHKEQIKDYMSTVKEIYPDFVVKGFIVYIEQARKEEVE